jgi:putative transposase
MRIIGGWGVMIMPDHIHLFCSPATIDFPPLMKWVSYWKSVSARNWPDQSVGKVWGRHFWDTQLRRGQSYSDKWQYIQQNPVRAGLVTQTEDWLYQGQMNELRWFGR